MSGTARTWGCCRPSPVRRGVQVGSMRGKYIKERVSLNPQAKKLVKMEVASYGGAGHDGPLSRPTLVLVLNSVHVTIMSHPQTFHLFEPV
jgi:hypothetical protein